MLTRAVGGTKESQKEKRNETIFSHEQGTRESNSVLGLEKANFLRATGVGEGRGKKGRRSYYTSEKETRRK